MAEKTLDEIKEEINKIHIDKQEEVNKINKNLMKKAKNKIKKQEKQEDKSEYEENSEMSENEKDKKDIEVLKENDFAKAVRHGILDLSSYTMINPEKRQRFAKSLKDSKIINDYVDQQLYLKFLKTNNPHVKCGIIYSYLYITELNKLG